MKDPDRSNKQKPEIERLREKALRRLKQRRPELFEIRADDAATLLHELDVHQAELEVQNEELRSSKAELAEAHEQYLKLFQFAPVGYLTLDAQGVIQRTNLMVSRLSGQRAEEMMGKRLEQLVAPEDSDDCFLGIREAALSGKAQRRELRFLGADESVYRTMIEIVPSGERAKSDKEAFRVTITDVTLRKQAEDDLRQNRDRLAWILDKTGVGVWLNILPAGSVSWDAQTKHLFFVPEDTEPTIELFFSRLHPEDREPTRLAIEKAIGNRTLYTIEHRAVNPDTGEIRWIRSMGQATYADDGTPESFDGINFDITWRRRAEEELRRLNETLEQRVAERTAEVDDYSEKLRSLASQLTLTEQKERKRLAQILHDHIQQLIVAARMQSEWIRHAKETEQIIEAAQTTTAILDEALAASRSLAVDLSPPVLHEIGLGGALKWLAGRMKEQHHFTVKMRFGNDAEPATEDIRFLLFDCARELLLNAVKHSDVREADAELVRMKSGRLKLVIGDAGKGFSVASIGEHDPKQNTFGLFNLQQRLRQIGGRIQIEAEPDKGTRITVVVPDDLAPPSHGEREEPMEDRDTGSFIETGGELSVCRVLVVDDHEVVREGLTKVLRMAADIELVGKAADGPQAIELVNKLNPDVVLMDVSLGEMNGAEATRRILAQHPKTKVIGLSVRDDEGVIEMMRQAGAVEHLSKSCHSKDILAAIRNCHNN